MGRTAGRPDDRTAERPNDQTTERPNDRTTERPNDQGIPTASIATPRSDSNINRMDRPPTLAAQTN
jgi:hypothetical protein